MPSDLNKMLGDVTRNSLDVVKDLKILFSRYEELYRESHRQFVQERNAAGSTRELEGFYRLVQTLKRNRDVVGSLIRGINNLRPLTGFKFVEEEEPEPTRPMTQEPVPDADRMQEVLQEAVEAEVIEAEGESNG